MGREILLSEAFVTKMKHYRSSEDGAFFHRYPLARPPQLIASKSVFLDMDMSLVTSEAVLKRLTSLWVIGCI